MRPMWMRGALVAILTRALFVLPGGAAEPAGKTGPEVGDRAPDFTLPATTGDSISLGQFRGKRAVLLEFYGADFSPV